MTKWAAVYAPLRNKPGGDIKLLSLPIGALVEPTGRIEVITYSGRQTPWFEVIYQTSIRAYVGWVYGPFLEDYVQEFPRDVVRILNATPDPTDAAQYMLWRGNKQFNMCGELCVCYCTGWDEDIDTFLGGWESKALNIFKRVFGAGRARGTDLGELDSMFSVYDYDLPSVRLSAMLTDPILDRPLVTPARMAAVLKTHNIIASCHIDGQSGNLRGSGILHWVVLEEVIPDEVNRGWVTLYNPFPNRMQRYSWDELIKSMGSPYGICVERSDADL